jgi:enoyl-CoA hydratase
MSALKLSISADKIATVTFDSPPHNLFNYSVYNEFKAMFDDLSERDDVWVVILNAAGKNFSFGNQVEEIQKLKASYADEHYRIVGEGLAAVYTCKKPTIGVVQGFAVGAGLAAPAACDIVIASDDAMFSIPEITVG